MSRVVRRGGATLALAALAVLTLPWLLVLLQAGTVLGASPTPANGGDPRSSGQGPGLVGDPGFAIVAVLAIGIGTLAVTLAYIRLTGGRRT